jgi:predicted amidohydrolase YtcJ
MIPSEELADMVAQLDADGMTVKFHAAGDQAVRAALDAIGAARVRNGNSGLLHNVGHNSFIQMDDILRARSIGATFEFSPYFFFPSPIMGDIARAVGEERMKRWTPVKDALDAGAQVVVGSDWAVVPSVNPWIAMETLVTRQKVGGTGEVLGEQERISLEEAFDLFTIEGARQLHRAAEAGSIEVGKRADLIVVDQNVFEVPITDVHKTQVLQTYIEGELVFDKEQPPR